jgi:hypothetical protein
MPLARRADNISFLCTENRPYRLLSGVCGDGVGTLGAKLGNFFSRHFFSPPCRLDGTGITLGFDTRPSPITVRPVTAASHRD